MAEEQPANNQGNTQWGAKPGLARALKIGVTVVPILAAVVASLVVGRVVGRPDGLILNIAWWVGSAVVATITMILVDKVARKALPLAGLYQLTIAFPDQAPSRFSVALKAGNVRRFEKQIAEARANGLPTGLNQAAVAAVELVTALSEHDRSTRGHSERVRAYAEMIGDELGLTDDMRDRLRWGALLHDIGKLTVPPAILNKPGRPDEHEWMVLQGHPAAGEKLLGPLAPFLGDAIHASGQHHERWDGYGYPRGLAGQDIAWAARIVAVADAFAVMTATRSYKKPMSAEAAREELSRCAGMQFDPNVVRAFLNVSLGKLRLAMGPVATLANLPFLGSTASAAASGGAASVAASSVASMAVVVAANVAPVPVLHEFAAPVERPAAEASAPESTIPLLTEPTATVVVVTTTTVPPTTTTAPTTTMPATTVAPVPAEPTLFVSTSSNRVDGVPLEGYVAGGQIFVYLTDAPGMSRVEFVLSDLFGTQLDRHLQLCAPWDLADTSSDCPNPPDAVANPLDVSTLGTGSYRVFAIVTRDGVVSEVTATFSVP